MDGTGTARASRPPMRIGSTRRARPVASSVSTKTPQTVAGPSAGLVAAAGDAGGEAPQRLFLLVADHAVVVGAGAGVGLVGGAAGQDLAVGGRHVGVGADHQAGAAVAEMAHGHLLGGGLGVHVDDDGVGHRAQRAGLQLAVDRGEGIVQRVHVHAAQQVDHQDPLAALGLEQLRAAARRVGEGRIVQRPDQPRLAHDVGQRLLLVPGVVAQRQAVGAGVEQLAGGGLGDAEAGGGVLGVDDHELEAEARGAGPAGGRPGPRGPSGRPRLRRRQIASEVLCGPRYSRFGQDGVQPLVVGLDAAPRRPPGRRRRGPGRTPAAGAQARPGSGRSARRPAPAARPRGRRPAPGR